MHLEMTAKRCCMTLFIGYAIPKLKMVFSLRVEDRREESMMLRASLILEFVRGGFIAQMKKFPCYHRKYQIKNFYCVNDFFISFREHPFQNCRKRVKAMDSCRKEVRDECLSLASKSTLMYSIYVRTSGKPKSSKKLNTDYCRNAGLIAQFVEQKSMKKIGCKLDYYMQKRRCIEQFQRKWRHNRSSSLLCSEYVEMEKCIDNGLKSFCSIEAIKKLNRIGKDVLSELSIDWNPFCRYSRKVLE